MTLIRELRSLSPFLSEHQSLDESPDGRRALNALAERGMRIVIDDFGVGYNSITYLSELPVAGFKLDRSLVARLPDNGTVRAIIRSLLGLAATLGLDVVAEGIENSEQAAALIAAGCRVAQGFGYARPMPVDELAVFFASGQSASADASRIA